jgi:hypothetical protein
MPGYQQRYRNMMLTSSVADPGSQQVMVRAVCEGSVVPSTMFPVTVTDGTHELQMTGMADALKIGTPTDYVRPTVSHKTAQHIADLLGMVVPTAKMMDAMADQAPFQVQSYSPPYLIDPKRSDGVGGGNFVRSEKVAGTIERSRTSMEEESDRIDQFLQHFGIPLGQPLLPGTAINQVGKVWITDVRLLQPAALKYGKETGINYGFWDTHAPRQSISSKKYKVWQRPGAFHDFKHTDYSQRLVLFNRKAAIRGGKYGPNWVTVDLDDVGLDKDTAGLINTGGIPMAIRHPWMPRFQKSDCQTMVASGPGGSGGGGAGKPTGPGGGGSPSKPPPKPGGGVAASKVTEVQYWLVGTDILSANTPATGLYLRSSAGKRPPTTDEDRAAVGELRRLASARGGRGTYEVRKMVWPLSQLPNGVPDLRIQQTTLDRFTLGGIVPPGGANV